MNRIAKETLSYINLLLTDAFLTSTSLSGRPVNFLSDNNHNQLLHNTAVTLLHCGKPTQAFDIFLNIVQVSLEVLFYRGRLIDR